MCVSYIGGKSKIAPLLIIPNIPKDIETFVEVFSGQFWTFFRMNLDEYPNLKRVVYNDINPLNYNMYLCLNNHQRLLEECEKFVVQEKGIHPTNPICEEQFNQFQSEIFNTEFTINYPNYEVAAKYVYVLTQVFSGANPEKSKFIDLKGKYHSKFTSFKNKLKNKFQIPLSPTPRWNKTKILLLEIASSVSSMSSVSSVSSVSSSNFPRKKVGRARGVKNIKLKKMRSWRERGQRIKYL
jgi:site-specific DNA-adenine methylase